MLMKHAFPKELYEKIQELGFHPVSFIPLYTLWSVVGIQDGHHFNIQLNRKDLSVDSVHLLKYRWNATGAKILDVTRIRVNSDTVLPRDPVRIAT